MIYQAVNELFAQGGSFLTTWDATDHIHFCCTKCAFMADILEVKFYPNYPADAKGTKLCALFIFLGCSKCGTTGFRKIYFRPTAYTGQKAFTDKNQVYVFAYEKEAAGTLQFEQPPKEKTLRAISENDSPIL